MKNAIVDKVVIMGSMEGLNCNQIADFLKANPKAELCLTLNDGLYYSLPKYNRFLDLQESLNARKLLDRVSFKITGNWARDVLYYGILSPMLKDILANHSAPTHIHFNLTSNNKQINLSDINVTINDLFEPRLAETIRLLNGAYLCRPVIHIDNSTEGIIDKLLCYTTDFDVVYRVKGDEQKAVKSYPNKFEQLYQGYEADFTSQNISKELYNIDQAFENSTPICIVAKESVKYYGYNTLDLDKAQAFVTAALTANTSSSAYDKLIPLPDDEEDPWAKYELGGY